MDQDWRNYAKSIQQAVVAVEKADISAKNKDLILRFRDFLVVEGISKARILKYLSTLKILACWLKKDFDTATKEDIMALVSQVSQRDFSEWTKHTYKVLLKRFYKWVRNSGDGYPEEVKWIKAHIKKDRIKLPNEGDLLSEGDIKTLLDCTSNIRDKALVSCLWESACRMNWLIFALKTSYLTITAL
ncbi:MAG TPA: phage integrase N-terminal SAM-like domain-containing protein [Candidatus Nanoarchaeia archaeon]|nr:phage integrase N-terminal SAM-like domain-containing protein [Candidatus Nanoarchaeia archaeon]